MEPLQTQTSLLLFGAAGAIGNIVMADALAEGWRVTATTRLAAQSSDQADAKWIAVDPFSPTFDPAVLEGGGQYDCVCWAHGANFNDNIYDFDADKHYDLYRANVLFILSTLHILLKRDLLKKPARLCLISSIWQNIARQNKLSYCVTKAALQGLVLSAAADIAKDGHMINAVLPGVLDTPMTRRNLSAAQLENIISATQFGHLPTLETVAKLVVFLCSTRNAGITGQFIEADLGFSHVRLI